MCLRRLRKGNAESRARCVRRKLSLAGAPERAHSEVEEHDHHNCRGDEGAVVGTVGVAHASAPKGGREDQHGQEKEDSGDLQPNDSTGMAERLQESTDAAGEAAAGGCGRAALSRRSGRGCGRLRGCRRPGGGESLGGHAARHTHPCAKDAADGFRSHFDMMVTAVPKFAAGCRFQGAPVAAGPRRQ